MKRNKDMRFKKLCVQLMFAVHGLQAYMSDDDIAKLIALAVNGGIKNEEDK